MSNLKITASVIEGKEGSLEELNIYGSDSIRINKEIKNAMGITENKLRAFIYNKYYEVCESVDIDAANARLIGSKVLNKSLDVESENVDDFSYCNDSELEQIRTHESSKTKRKTVESAFSNTQSFGFSNKTSFELKIIFIGNTKQELSFNFSSSFNQSGKIVDEEIQITKDTYPFKIPAYRNLQALVISKRGRASIEVEYIIELHGDVRVNFNRTVNIDGNLGKSHYIDIGDIFKHNGQGSVIKFNQVFNIDSYGDSRVSVTTSDIPSGGCSFIPTNTFSVENI